MASPRNRLLRRHDEGGASGLPRSGLISAHHFYYPNLLLQSETFDHASWTPNPDVTGVTADQAVAPDGQMTMDLMSSLDAASLERRIRCTHVWLADTTYRFRIVAKAKDCSFLRLRPLASGADDEIWFNVATGEVGTITGAIFTNPTITPIGTGSYECAVTFTTGAISFNLLDIGFSANDNERVSVVAVGNGLYLWGAQLYPAATLPDYAATTDLQSVSGAYGTTPALIRGISTGNTTNDWTILGPGAGFATDDLGLSPDLTGITMAGAFTLYTAGKFNGTAGSILSLAGSAATTDFQRVAYNGSGKVRIGSKAGAAAETNSADLDVSTTANTVLELKSDGTTLTLANLTTGTAVTLAAQAATGACRLGVFCNALSTIATISDAATGLSAVSYGRALSASERVRTKRAIQAFWGSKAVTVL